MRLLTGTDVQPIGGFGSRNYGYQMFLSYLRFASRPVAVGGRKELGPHV